MRLVFGIGKRVLALAAALCALAPAVRAQDAGTQSVFSLGAGSRALGLGRSFVSLADDASAVYWNPAALRNVQSGQITAMYMPLFGDFTDADYTYAGFVYPTLHAGAFGAAFMHVGSTFEGFDAASRPTGEQGYSESQLLISYAFEKRSRWLLGTLAAGATAKVSRITVDPYASTAPGADLGLRWIPDFARSLALAVNVQDFIGAEHRLDVDAERTDRTVLAGAGYTAHFGGGSSLRLLLQMDFPERADSRFHAGAEFAFARYLALRAGYDDGEFAFGLGVSLSRFAFDYAMMSREVAGSSHPVSFTVLFGSTLDERRLAADERRAREEQEAIQRAFSERVATHRDEAARRQAAGDWESALDEWKIVLEYVPGDEEAMAGATAARERIVESQAQAVRDVETQAVIRTRFTQGLAAFEEQNWARARSEWQAILVVDSSHAGAADYLRRTQEHIDDAVRRHAARATELETAGRLTEAIAEWNNVQQYDPESAQARRAIERIRTRIESASADLAAAQRRLRVVGLYDEALRLYNQGEYEQARTRLEELLRLQPNHEDAKNLLALAKRRLQPLSDEEKVQIRQLYLRGMQFFSRDEYAKAIAEWEKILEIDPGNESVRGNIKEARARLERLKGRD
jgi:tetratricopeptide (TPR) repeat protein